MVLDIKDDVYEWEITNITFGDFIEFAVPVLAQNQLVLIHRKLTLK